MCCGKHGNSFCLNLIVFGEEHVVGNENISFDISLEFQTSSDPSTWVGFGNEIAASLSLFPQWYNEHVYEKA